MRLKLLQNTISIPKLFYLFRTSILISNFPQRETFIEYKKQDFLLFHIQAFSSQVIKKDTIFHYFCLSRNPTIQYTLKHISNIP